MVDDWFIHQHHSWMDKLVLQLSHWVHCLVLLLRLGRLLLAILHLPSPLLQGAYWSWHGRHHPTSFCDQFPEVRASWSIDQHVQIA